MFSFNWVRESEWREIGARVAVLEVNPNTVQPALSVQPAWNRSQGIIRGSVQDGVLLEDHICEVIDDAGNLVDVGRNGHRIVGSVEMREQVWTVDHHVAQYQASHPDERVLAWVGNGNLLCNPHFVGFDGTAGRGQLFCLASELAQLGCGGRSYSCLLVRKPAFRPRVSIERVFFGDSGTCAQVWSEDGRSITAELDYVTFGQTLVTLGRAVGDDDIIRMARNGEFYDLRHLFLFGRMDTGTHRWIDIGLAGFWDAAGHLDQAVVERAFRGGPVSADVRQFPVNLVRTAMEAKGYDLTPEAHRCGQYSLREGRMQVVLRRGVYPHSMIGVRNDGRLILAAIDGLSNRVGTTISGAAQIMQSLGAEEALLIDNGHDVTMCFDNEDVFSPSVVRRNRLRSIILLRTHLPRKALQPQDIRLVKYPQVVADEC